MSNRNLIIIENEKIFEENNNFYCDNIDSKSIPEGLSNIKKTHPSLKLFTASIDKGLNKNKFIIPGLGDAGDRYMGT